MTEITNRTKNAKNKILAIPTAEPAIPPKPNTAATSDITKKVTDQLNIYSPYLIVDHVNLN